MSLSQLFTNPTGFFITLVLSLLGLSVCASGVGCARGTASSWSHANPQHEFSLAFDPISRTFRADYFSNDGQELHCKHIEMHRGADSLIAEDLAITDKSVENRIANVEQVKETTKQWDRFLTTMDNTVNKLSPGLNSIIGRAPQQPSLGGEIGAGIGDAIRIKAGGVAKPEPATQPN